MQEGSKNLNKLYCVRFIVPERLYTDTTKTKEVQIMKHTAKNHRKSYPHLHVYRRPYPNAAEPRYYIDKAIDAVLAVVTGLGTVSAMLFLVTM